MASLRAGIDSDKSRRLVTRLGHTRVKVWANTWGGRIEVTLLQSGTYDINITDFSGKTTTFRASGTIDAPIRKRDGTLKPRTAPKPRTPRTPRKLKTVLTPRYIASVISETSPAATLPESGNAKAVADDDTLPLSDEDRALMEAV